MIFNYFSVYFSWFRLWVEVFRICTKKKFFFWFRVSEFCFVGFVVNFKKNFQIPRRILCGKHQILTVISTHLFNSSIPSIAFIGFRLYILIQSYVWSEKDGYFQTFRMQTVTKLLWSFFHFILWTIWCKNEIVNPVYTLPIVAPI